MPRGKVMDHALSVPSRISPSSSESGFAGFWMVSRAADDSDLSSRLHASASNTTPTRHDARTCAMVTPLFYDTGPRIDDRGRDGCPEGLGRRLLDRQPARARRGLIEGKDEIELSPRGVR